MIISILLFVHLILCTVTTLLFTILADSILNKLLYSFIQHDNFDLYLSIDCPPFLMYILLIWPDAYGQSLLCLNKS